MSSYKFLSETGLYRTAHVGRFNGMAGIQRLVDRAEAPERERAHGRRARMSQAAES
jgi:hypothetical protein